MRPCFFRNVWDTCTLVSESKNDEKRHSQIFLALETARLALFTKCYNNTFYDRKKHSGHITMSLDMGHTRLHVFRCASNFKKGLCKV